MRIEKMRLEQKKKISTDIQITKVVFGLELKDISGSGAILGKGELWLTWSEIKLLYELGQKEGEI